MVPELHVKAKELNELHKQGIEKSTSHVFVYRFPESDDLPAMDCQEFVGQLKEGEKKERALAFYLHIPFCSKICSYCHYFKQTIGSEKQTMAFLDAVKKEIGFYRALLEEKVSVNSILFGGGTPTALKAEQLEDLMLFLKASFPVESKKEATIESSPETLNEKKLIVLRQHFNRLSIGVQDFNDAVLKACNRDHDRKQAIKAVEDARNAGFDNINIDLIYGLPGQGIGGWKKTLEEIEAMQPESATASDLRIQKGSAFFYQGKKDFASEAELIEMHSMFIEKMLGLGYRQLFPYQFVKEGKEMRFLQNQWGSGEFLGFGPSSCSFLNKWDYNNVFPTEEYVDAVEEKGIACAVGKKLDKEEQMVRFVALALKDCKKGIDGKRFKQEFGIGVGERFGSKIKELCLLGLVEEKDDSLKLSLKGTLFYDAVSRKFFP